MLGANNYLLSIRRIDTKLVNKMNKLTRNAVINACRLHTTTPTILQQAEGRILKFEQIWSREQIRFYLQLKSAGLNNANNIATKMLLITTTYPNTNKIYRTWYQTFQSDVTKKIFKLTNINILNLSPPAHVATTASSIIRQYAILKWQAESLKAINKWSSNDEFTIIHRPKSINIRFIGGYRMQHLYDLFHGFQQKCTIYSDNNLVFNKLSLLGPTSVSSIISNSSIPLEDHIVQFLSKIREGRSAIFTHPINKYLNQQLSKN